MDRAASRTRPEKDPSCQGTAASTPTRSRRRTDAGRRSLGFERSSGERLLHELGLAHDDGLLDIWENPPKDVQGWLYLPGRPPSHEWSLAAALRALGTSAHPPFRNLVPLMLVDDRSIACVACRGLSLSQEAPSESVVVRWHLDDIPVIHQAALLDVSARRYVASVIEELAERDPARATVRRITAAYRSEHLLKNIGAKPYVARPVQLACQNVVLALSAFSYDSSFDGLSVPAWTTCEVPHVATHEANRALVAMMLCDAFASGGTMEVRFGYEKPQTPRRVPASLRRFARVVGVDIADAATRLTPSESRELFLAVTPMPASLRSRVMDYVARGVTTPERVCYVLMAQIWRDIELDFLLATSPRASSILCGGAPWSARPARMAETEVARSAVLLGTLRRRLDSRDSAGVTSEARVFEDATVGVTWQVLPDHGAVVFENALPGPLPWTGAGSHEGRFIALPRARPTAADYDVASELSARLGIPAGIVAPAGTEALDLPTVATLQCPDSLADLDREIETKLSKARVTRA